MAVELYSAVVNLCCQKSSCQWIKSRLQVKTEGESHTSLNQIKTQLKPLVTVLKFICGYPIIIVESINSVKLKEARNNLWVRDGSALQHDETVQEIHYDIVAFNGKSLWMWCSYVIKIVNIVVISVVLLNLSFDIPFPVKLVEFCPSFRTQAGSTVASFNAESCTAIAGVMKILGMVTVLLNTKPFVLWLNSWNEFEDKFLSCFGNKQEIHFKADIQKFLRNVLMYCFFIPQILLILFGLPFMAQGFVLHVEYVSYVVLGWGSIALWQQEILEECKVHILVQTNVLAFEQIREGIIKQKTKSELNPSDVIAWRSLIILARNQTTLLFSALKSQQLLSVVDAIIICSMGLSGLLLVAAEGDFSTITTPPFIGTLSMCSSSLVKLYIKILRAEKIPAQELLIATEILELDAKCFDPSTKAELKFLHKMLTQDTIKNNLGNYCMLDKNLLLQVGMQVVTYLIVIIQFKGTSGVSAKAH